MSYLYRLWIAAFALASSVACDDAEQTPGILRAPVVFDNDDRRDYFEVSDAAIRNTVEQSIVAVMFAEIARSLAAGGSTKLRSLGEKAELCAGEAFGSQPAAALCSGVLLDWDLVLVAKHCVERVPLENLAVVFGYYLTAPDTLAATPDDVYALDAVVAASEHSDDSSDYAWLRLARAATAPHRPAAVYTQPFALAPATRLTVMSATSGIPLKVDQGAEVFGTESESRAEFVASSDTFQGSSGGGAFDASLGLVGVLANGARDYVATDAGCNVVRRVVSAEAPVTETYTSAERAVHSLCAADDSPLCDDACVQPCRVPPATSCSTVLPGLHKSSWMAWLAIALLAACRRARVIRVV